VVQYNQLEKEQNKMRKIYKTIAFQKAPAYIVARNLKEAKELAEKHSYFTYVDVNQNNDTPLDWEYYPEAGFEEVDFLQLDKEIQGEIFGYFDM